MSNPAETILQFGAGRFLRAFADLFVHQANAAGQDVGRIVVVQSTGDDRAAVLNRLGGRYHVVVRGLNNGVVVDRIEVCESISRAVSAAAQWDEVRALARSPQLKLILSNTTEKGYDLDAADTPDSVPPRSFPAKLLAVLRERFDSGGPGLTIIPCELHERNADILLDIVDRLANQWGLSSVFRTWLREKCAWLDTLVDRIVTGTPREHPLLAEDPMLTVCEPYALWVIRQRPHAWKFMTHPAIVRTDDVMPYFLRKVRILNAGHTALLIRSWPRGFRTVREAVSDPEMGAWLERLFAEELVPTLQGRVVEPEAFARQTLERFRNPFLEHKLADIALHHEAKVRVRLEPTRTEFIERFGRRPPLLDEVLGMPAPVVGS
jgi:tagaturonate reductase